MRFHKGFGHIGIVEVIRLENLFLVFLFAHLSKVVQLNKCETVPYFLQNFQCNTMFISVFCKSCEPMLCEPEIVSG